MTPEVSWITDVMFPSAASPVQVFKGSMSPEALTAEQPETSQNSYEKEQFSDNHSSSYFAVQWDDGNQNVVFGDEKMYTKKHSSTHNEPHRYLTTLQSTKSAKFRAD